MKKTGIFFDFDGTLFYGTTDINYYSINLALQDMNRPPISREEANTTVGDRLEDACRRILHSDDQDLCARLLQGIIGPFPGGDPALRGGGAGLCPHAADAVPAGSAGYLLQCGAGILIRPSGSV